MPKTVEYEVGIRESCIKISLETFVNNAGNQVAEIHAGGKSLIVEVSPCGWAKSFLENTANPHVNGETTAVYSAARDFLEEQATEQDRPIKYEFETGFSSMKGWADGEGERLFRWQDKHPTIDDPQKIMAHALIPPKTK